MKPLNAIVLGIGAGGVANAFVPTFTIEWLWLYAGICALGIFLKMDWK